jgi:glycosyltransferase involved in cell wall biosynthesis
MLLRTLPRLTDFEHTVLTLHHRGELAAEFEKAGIQTENSGFSSLTSLASYRRLAQRVRQLQPDLIFTYLFHADMIGRFSLQFKVKAPVIPYLRTTYNNPAFRIARVVELLSRPLASQYLANSESVKAFYSSRLKVPATRITVIPNGIDISHFSHPRSHHPDTITLICVANLHSYKGHRYLLEAFGALYPTHPHLQLLIVGEGKERKALQALAATLPGKEQIQFLGKRHDVPELLSQSDIFVLPTLLEGLSNAILEAMAAGLPCVVSDIPENRQIIDGKNGILTSVDTLAAALEPLIDAEDLRHQLGAAARATIEKEFSLTAVAQQWSQFIHTIIKR